jgi:hypothetical protein
LATGAGIIASLTLIFTLGMRYLPAYKGEAIEEMIKDEASKQSTLEPVTQQT